MIIFFSCATLDQPDNTPEDFEGTEKNIPVPAPTPILAEERPFVINFAGDIMAHSVNSRMKDFSLIYADIEVLLKQADLSLANFETPVTEALPYKTYPQFNVKNAYAEAAINAGFNVFSLANNHMTDQGLPGITATRDFFSDRESQGIYSSGLRQSAGAEFSYAFIEQSEWKILFVAVSEFFNENGPEIAYINHVPPNAKKRELFINQIQQLKTTLSPDLTILYIHVYEEEYKITVSESRKQFMRELAKTTADIVYASHPHVSQEWEIITDTEENNDKLIMYSLGNLISGQRYTLNLNNPQDAWEYTGDMFLLQLSLTKRDGKRFKLTHHLLTNYVDTDKNVLIKQFTPEFIESLPSAVRNYYQTRFELMSQFKTRYYQENTHEN